MDVEDHRFDRPQVDEVDAPDDAAILDDAAFLDVEAGDDVCLEHDECHRPSGARSRGPPADAAIAPRAKAFTKVLDEGGHDVERFLIIANFALAVALAACARAYDESSSPERIETLVLEGVRMFAEAANEVESYHSRQMAIAAE